MQLQLPSGEIIENPSEDQVIQAVNGTDPNRPEKIRLTKSHDDWVEVSMTRDGLRLQSKDPTTGLTLQTTGPYLSKSTVVMVVRGYMNDAPNWNTHTNWAPLGAGKKKGCLGAIVLLILSVSLIAWML